MERHLACYNLAPCLPSLCLAPLGIILKKLTSALCIEEYLHIYSILCLVWKSVLVVILISQGVGLRTPKFHVLVNLQVIVFQGQQNYKIHWSVWHLAWKSILWIHFHMPHFSVVNKGVDLGAPSIPILVKSAVCGATGDAIHQSRCKLARKGPPYVHSRAPYFRLIGEQDWYGSLQKFQTW